MPLTIPDFCLVLTFGAPSASFDRAELIQPDAALADARLKQRKLAVIDATTLNKADRSRLIAAAKRNHAEVIAIVAAGPGRSFGNLLREGIRTTYNLGAKPGADGVEVVRVPLACDKRNETGPFDIIGDVHGCADELETLLAKLAYRVSCSGTGPDRTCAVTALGKRRAIFVGDLVDRGPRTPDVLRIVMEMVAKGLAFAVAGNHDVKFGRWLNGRDVQFTNGLRVSAEQMAMEAPAFRVAVGDFIGTLPAHLWLDGGALAVAHAGIRQEMIGRSAGGVREFCLYGDATGETDAYGLPVRLDWAADYRGDTAVVYGHTVVRDAVWLNNTICIDTGCCFGGRLTAVRWPERVLVSVPAVRAYTQSKRPLDETAP